MKTFLILFGVLAITTTVEASSNPLNPSQDKPMRVYAESYAAGDTLTWIEDYDDGTDLHVVDEAWNYSVHWSSTAGGAARWQGQQTVSDSVLGYFNTGNDWTDWVWPSSDPENGQVTDAAGDTGPVGSPLIWEHCQLGVPLEDKTGPEGGPGSFWNLTDNESRSAQATIKLQTGGKAVSKLQNLFCISASATKIVPIAQPWPWTNSVPHLPVAAQDITVAGKALGSDGKLWVMLPDSPTPIDVTPQVGADYYTFSVGQPVKYHPYIGLSTSTTNCDITTNTPEVCVGQTVTLGADWLGGISPPAVAADIRWSLPGKYVNQPTNYSSTCLTYVKNTDLLTNWVQQCWYVNQPGGNASVGMMLHFANGQSTFVEAKGSFTVFRPSVSFGSDPLWPAPRTPMVTNGWLELGNDLNGYGIVAFKAAVTSKANFSDGSANWTQLCNRSTTYAQSTSGYWLDNGQFFNGGRDVNPITIPPLNFVDNPGVASAWAYVSCADSFKTYLVFNPGGDGIGVTLGIVTWGWSGTETLGALSSSSTTSPMYSASDEFPVWPNIIHTSPGE